MIGLVQASTEETRLYPRPLGLFVMSKSDRPKDLTGKTSFGLSKINISAAYFIFLDWQDFKNQCI